MKDRSITCLLWIAAFILLAIGCAVYSFQNKVMAFYAFGFVALAWVLWKSEE